MNILQSLKSKTAKVVGLAALVGTLGHFTYSHYTSDEYKKGKELDGIASIVLPKSAYEEAKYSIDEKEARVEAGVWQNKRGWVVGYSLDIDYDNVKYTSEDWNIYDSKTSLLPFFEDGPDGDARNLETVEITGTDGAVRKYDIVDLPNKNEWQSKYETLLRKIAVQKIDADKKANETILRGPN